MNRSALFKLITVLAGLAVLSWFFIYFSKSNGSPRLAKEALSGKAVRLELSGPNGHVLLTRSSSTWTMESPFNYPADHSVVETVLDGLKDVSLSGELSGDPARYGLFGLNGSSATHVQVFTDKGGSPALDFFVGKGGADYNTFYTHLGDGPGVMEAQGLSQDAFARKPEEWLDKTVCRVPPESIRSLKITYGKLSIKLNHAEGKWVVEGSGRVISSATVELAVGPVLTLLNPFEAENILPAQNAPSLDQMGFDHPELTVDAEGMNPVLIKVGQKNDRGFRYVLKSDEHRVYFLCGDWRFNPLRVKELFALKENKK